MSSLFCRHNRFTADCPICAKGTVLDPSRQASRPRTSPGATSRRAGKSAAAPATAARVVTGPYASAGPYTGPQGTYDVRLERVPGGVRLAAWAAGSLARRAPVLGAADLAELVAGARERSILPPRDLEPLEQALATEPHGVEQQGYGVSPGRAGDLLEELRVEPLDEGSIRIARWIHRPNRGWELQEAPVMLPAKRLAQAIGDAVRKGILVRFAADGGRLTVDS